MLANATCGNAAIARCDQLDRSGGGAVVDRPAGSSGRWSRSRGGRGCAGASSARGTPTRSRAAPRGGATLRRRSGAGSRWSVPTAARRADRASRPRGRSGRTSCRRSAVRPGRTGAVIIVSRRGESVPWLIGIAFGQPGGAAGEQHERVERRRSRRCRCAPAPPATRSRGPSTTPSTACSSAARYGSPATPTELQPGGAHQLLDLRRLQLHVHQRGGRADAGGAEDHDRRRQAADVDDGDPIAGPDAAVGERRRRSSTPPAATSS